MEYSADRPIKSIDEDRLKRGTFSQQLGRAIYEYGGEDSLVIGIYGKWGTGKTSILNMAIQELETISDEDSNKPIIVKFNPWLYLGQTNLINQFFTCLNTVIGKDTSKNFKKTVGSALTNYSGVLATLTALSQFAVLAPVVKDFAKVTGDLLQNTADLESIKEKLEQVLSAEKRKIVVVIDDIDRLTNVQIQDIFQLVKQVGSLPYVIYVLSMDREVVQRALADVHNCDGSEYLDKIVQIPFEIPVLSGIKLHEIFVSNFYGAIKEISNDIRLERDYLHNVCKYCVDPYISTLRDVTRIINTFKFRYSILYHETSCEDMIGMTTLEVLEPKLYEWISCNKDILCGGGMHDMLLGVMGRKSEEHREKYVKIFNELGIDPEKAVKCIAAMFPVFAEDTGEYYHYYHEHDALDIRSQMRIAQPERFELYFMFNLDDIPVSREFINSCIYDLDEEGLAEIIIKANNQGNIIYFLNEIKALIDNIPYGRIGMIAKILLYFQHEFIGKEEFGLYIESPYHLSSYCADDMIKRLNTADERYCTYSQALAGTSIYSLGAIAHAINLLELAYGRLASNHEEKAGQIIRLDQLQKLEKEFVDKIIELSSRENLIEAEDFDMCFYLWSCLDKESANIYINEGFKNDIFKLKFVCRMAKPWYGSGGNGWSYDSCAYQEYISDEAIHNLIQEKVKIYINDFTEIELVKLASFVLIYQNDRVEKYNVQEATKLVDEWQSLKA